MAQNGRGLRLLSIDGGGIRGLSPLLMLKEILYRIQQEKQLDYLPRPCDIFDLAGGTNTGGLIVIMLFRLRLSIDKAITVYVTLANHVSEQKRPFQDGKSRASRLEEAIVSIIQEALEVDPEKARSVRMLDGTGHKGFVCAMPAGNFSFPSLFRTWIPPANRTYDCTIVEAARATTADPTFFKSIEFGEPIRLTYLDGGLRCNNPVKYVIDEARSHFPDRLISCVISLGTGAANVIGLERPDATNFIRILKAIAADCEICSEETARSSAAQSFSYFRLNVDQGLQTVSLAEWEKLEAVNLHTLQYLRKHDVGEKVNRLVQVLKADTSAEEVASTGPTKQLSEIEYRSFKELKESIALSAYHDSNERSTSSVCLKGTRKDQIQAITEWIESDGGKPVFVVLGPAGSGKTSLLNTIAEICKQKGHYGAGFFFSGIDPSRNTTGRFINTIAYQVTVAIPQLQPYIARIIETDSTILDRSLESQIDTLLLEPLHLLRSDHPKFAVRQHVIIIDALNECGELSDQIRVLTALTKVLANESFPFICLLSSRYNPHIEAELANKLDSRIHGRVALGNDERDERADISAYLRVNVDRIRDTHGFGRLIPQEWPMDSDLENIAKKSGGQFLYASTVIRYVESPKHNPYRRLQYILGISTDKSGANPFAELDVLYHALMSLVEDIETAIEILGIELVKASPQYWMPSTVKYKFDFTEHFCSLDADVVLAPLAPLLKCEDGNIKFHHLSFSEFLLDSIRSGDYFRHPGKWHKWIVSQLVSFLYDGAKILVPDVLHLIKEAKPGTDLHQAINDGLALVVNHPKVLPSGGDFNIWPFVTSLFFDQLHFKILIEKMATVFVQRGENFLPLPILIKFAMVSNFSNSFLLFELCRTCAELQKTGFIQFSPLLVVTSPDHLLLFTTYLAGYLDDQNVLLPKDYISVLQRCLWYLQSSSCHIRSSLREQLRSLKQLSQTLGIHDYLEDTCSNLTRGALDALSIFLPHAPPSDDLFVALKCRFHHKVMSRTPSSSRKAMGSIHGYLMQHDPEYQQCEGDHAVESQSVPGEDELLPDFEVFLLRKRK